MSDLSPTQERIVDYLRRVAEAIGGRPEDVNLRAAAASLGLTHGAIRQQLYLARQRTGAADLDELAALRP